MEYTAKNICPTHISFDVDNEGCVHNVKYSGGGCVANLKTIGMLVEGMKATEVIERLEGIMCKDKGSSCGDQLAQALKEYLG